MTRATAGARWQVGGVQTAGATTLTVAVVIEVPLFRESVTKALAGISGFRAYDVDPAAVCERLAELAPHIALVDASRADVAGLVRAVVDVVPDLRIVAVAMPDSEQQLFACAEAGVAGLVPWDASLDEVASTLRDVARDELPCSPRVAAALLRHVSVLAAGQRAVGATPGALTRRELEIAGLIDEGLSNKEIAAFLRIEVTTVKNHVHSILEKVKVRRRGEAAARLRAAGVLRPVAAAGSVSRVDLVHRI